MAVKAEGGAKENQMVPLKVTKSIKCLSVVVRGEVGAQKNLMTPFEITKLLISLFEDNIMQGSDTGEEGRVTTDRLEKLCKDWP